MRQFAAARQPGRGTVDGHSFYFRERHDRWRIELDLAPTGRIVEVWTGADDEGERRYRELDEADVIAEGATGVPGYGTDPTERAAFIVAAIRDHLRRQDCSLHTAGRDLLEALLGSPPGWCPACGTRIPDRSIPQA